MAELKKIRNGCWIDAVEPDETELEQLTELTGLNRDDFVDALDEFEIPRIEKVSGHVIIFMRFPSITKSGLYTQTLTLIVSDDYLITILTGKSELIKTIFKNNENLLTTQRSKLVMYILLQIVNRYTREVKKVRTNIMQQKKTYDSISDRQIKTLVDNEDVLNQYLSALIPIKNVISLISAGKFIYLYPEDEVLLEDLINAVEQSIAVCTVNVKSIRALRDSYQILFTNKLNRLLKVLTSVTIILTIPTMIFSAYGMNVALPGQDSPIAFFEVMSLTLLFTLLMLVFFYWRDLF